MCDTKILIIEAICHKKKPCVNGGSCLDGFCQCPTNFTGDLCESRVNPTTSSLYHTDSVSPTTEFLSSEGVGATTDNAAITMHNNIINVESTDLTGTPIKINVDNFRINTNSNTQQLITNNLHSSKSEGTKETMTTENIFWHLTEITTQNLNSLPTVEQPDQDQALALPSRRTVPLFESPVEKFAQLQKSIQHPSPTGIPSIDTDINELSGISENTDLMISDPLRHSHLVANKRRCKNVVRR